MFLQRRTLLQLIAGAGSAIRAWAQPAPVFTEAQSKVLRDLAVLVLPSGLKTDSIAADFERHVLEYRAGADTEHGYGFTRVRPTPASPAPEYRKQLSAFPSRLTREAIAISLEQSQIKDLPRLPDGKSVVADLMSFYFRSAKANDLCYRAAIQREACRGLAGSSKEPSRL